MKTIAILLMCVCGTLGVVYAATLKVAADAPKAGMPGSIVAAAEKMAAPKLALGALGQRFIPMAAPGECDFD